MYRTSDKIRRALGGRATEDCIQCGREGNFAIIAVMRDQGGPALLRVGDWGGFPICPSCHREPRVKAHFHARANLQMAVSRAGSSDLGT